MIPIIPQRMPRKSPKSSSTVCPRGSEPIGAHQLPPCWMTAKAPLQNKQVCLGIRPAMLSRRGTERHRPAVGSGHIGNGAWLKLECSQLPTATHGGRIAMALKPLDLIQEPDGHLAATEPKRGE